MQRPNPRTPELAKKVLASRRGRDQLAAHFLPIGSFLDGVGRASVCCPFHGDQRPSAKLYDDEDGTQRLYCFACDRQYTGADYVREMLGRDPLEYALEFHSVASLISTTAFMESTGKVDPPAVAHARQVLASVDAGAAADLDTLLTKYWKGIGAAEFRHIEELYSHEP